MMMLTFKVQSFCHIHVTFECCFSTKFDDNDDDDDDDGDYYYYYYYYY